MQELKARPGVLVILDGFGINPSREYNAVALAKMPVWEKLLRDCPHTQLEASEQHVGLPRGFMGNSEVGHLNIGAGRVVYQDFSLISKAIEDESFFTNTALVGLMQAVKKDEGALHLIGLVSDGGVHSHISHLYALLQLAKRQETRQVWIHVITDGRDCSPTSGLGFVEKLEDFCRDLGLGKVATVSGRFYAMDRDKRWERTEAAYQAMVSAESGHGFKDPSEYVRRSYEENVTDEFILPAAAADYRGVDDGDGVLFFNFRADRARQLTRVFTQTEFTEFKRSAFPTLAGFVTMSMYDSSFQVGVAYEKPSVPNTLGEWLSKHGGRQLRVAETEKYAHVTYFFNGGWEQPFPDEKRVLVPSPRDVRTYDLKPEMSAEGVTDRLLEELKSVPYQLAVVNFANPDMVGHTGNLPAAIEAVEAVDACLGRIVDWVQANKGFAVFTADHGNCECMQDEKGQPMTAHTLLPVPFVLLDPRRAKAQLRAGGKLCDIAPTLLELWDMPKPSEMTGKSLLHN